MLPLDWILCGVVALVTGIGLFRGLSGELGSLAGFAAALVAGFLLYGTAQGCAGALGLGEGLATPAGAVIDFVFALVAFGVARWLVARFVSLLVPQPTNALLGALGGLFKSAVILGLLVGIGFIRPGAYATGPLTAHSAVLRQLAAWADAYAAGAARE